MGCYNSELPIGPPGPTGPQGPAGELPYKIYTALLTQVDDAAPTAIVLENTIEETPTFSRTAEGSYSLIVTGGIFVQNKIAVFYPPNPVFNLDNGTSAVEISYSNTNNLLINTYDKEFLTTQDNRLNGCPIEIRIYP